MLCSSCKNYFEKGDLSSLSQTNVLPLSFGTWNIRRSNAGETVSSSGDLCDFCFFVMLVTNRKTWEDSDRSMTVKAFRTAGGLPTKSQEYCLRIACAGLQIGLTLVNLSDLIENYPLRQPLESTYTGSRSTLDIAANWVQTCNNGHETCTNIRRKSQSDVSWLPTRLLEIVDNQTNVEDPTVFLRDNVDPLHDSRYATLTYCRGSKVIRTLTTTTLTELKNGISVSSLPKTFQDAVVVTLHLGLRFLWVDALCIFQDVGLDWLNESMTMSKVYTYSHINISAMAATESDGGLFHDRDVTLLNGCKLDISWEGIEQGEYLCIPMGTRAQNVTFSPLSRRAWAVQEAFLSSRTLFFASNQIYWECCESRVSEIDPAEESWGNYFDFQQHHKKDFAKLRIGKHLSQDEFTSMWIDIVHEYTLGKLTRQSDKLVAISGIVQVVAATRPHDDYLAGHWRSSLSRSLLWRGRPDDDKLSRPETYIAPSWSWASVDGPTICMRMHPPFSNTEELILDILEANTTPVAHPLGPVCGGHIKVKGHLCPARLALADGFPNYSPWSLCIDGYKTCKWYVSVAMDNEISVDWPRSEHLYCLEFTHDVSAEQAPEEHIQHDGPRQVSQGLILQATGSARGQFRRVGYFKTLCWSDKRRARDYFDRISELKIVSKSWDVLRGFDDHKVIEAAFTSKGVREDHFEEFDGIDRYTITIV